MIKWKTKLKNLLWRYGPAEIVAICCAYASYLLTHHLVSHPIAHAYAAAWGENIGFYSVIISREIRHSFHLIKNSPESTFKICFTKIIHMFSEFGPAEAVDSLLLRPLFMGLGIRYLGYGYGIITGKLISDIFFYLPVIISYELRLRYYRRINANK